jgi:hypothetical protein
MVMLRLPPIWPGHEQEVDAPQPVGDLASPRRSLPEISIEPVWPEKKSGTYCEGTRVARGCRTISTCGLARCKPWPLGLNYTWSSPFGPDPGARVLGPNTLWPLGHVWPGAGPEPETDATFKHLWVFPTPFKLRLRDPAAQAGACGCCARPSRRLASQASRVFGLELSPRGRRNSRRRDSLYGVRKTHVFLTPLLS